MFKVNGQEFAVGISELQRGIKKEMKYEAITEDGTRHGEVKGIYPVYNLTLGSIRQEDYDALYTAVNTYAQSVEVTLPYGQENITFNAVVELGGDGLIFIERDGTRRWDGLTLTVSGVKPMER